MLVTWEIDVFPVDGTPLEAAKLAREYMSAADSIATIFEVHADGGKVYEVDLWDETVKVSPGEPKPHEKE